MFKINNKDTSTLLSSVSTNDFEQVNVARKAASPLQT